ncbi:DUF6807 family protein [Verrucomicrobiota bacterium sgz303538]
MFPKSFIALSGLISCLLSTSSLATAATFSIQERPGEALDVLKDGKVLARYMCGYDMSTPAKRDETYKPYLHVFDAEGKDTITKGPGGLFPHHRGIFIGWNKLSVGGQVVDRWHMKGGELVHRKFLNQKADANGASFTSLVEWTGKDPQVLLSEERTFTFLPAPAPAYALIDTVSKLKAVGGETVLNGDPEHAGLQFRPSSDIDPSKTIYVFPGEKPDLKKGNLPWFGGSFTIRGKRYSVVYLNHPSNPKDAPVSAYRDYGRFGAFFKDTIPAGGERTIRARFLITEGEMPSADLIQKTWNEYAGANEPTPKTTVKPAEVSKPAAPKPAKADASAPAAQPATAPAK